MSAGPTTTRTADPVEPTPENKGEPGAVQEREQLSNKQAATRQSRVDIANQFLRIVSEHGRHFFAHEGRVARFELDERDRVWFVDAYTQRRIWTHQEGSWGRHFTNGGTLLRLCKELRDFIMDRAYLPVGYLGPWPDTLCGGDLWGYGESMATVRERCAALAPTEEEPALRMCGVMCTADPRCFCDLPTDHDGEHEMLHFCVQAPAPTADRSDDG